MDIEQGQGPDYSSGREPTDECEDTLGVLADLVQNFSLTEGMGRIYSSRMETTRTPKPVIYSPSVLVAQSVTLSEAEKAILVTKADRIREILGNEDKVEMNVEIRYIHEPHEIIGWMGYWL